MRCSRRTGGATPATPEDWRAHGTQGDHFLRRHARRPRRTDVRTHLGRRRRVADAGLRPPHAPSDRPLRRSVEEREAETLLARGAGWLADLEVEHPRGRQPIDARGPAPADAEEERADIVVFGSDYRTAPGRVAPQHTTQSLLECGPAAVAIAPADYRSDGRRGSTGSA